MPQQPTTGGGANQTLLELIYSLKGLAQTVEFFHQDLSRKLDEESKARARELERLRDIVSKNSQAISILPITFSDRAERLVNKLGADVGEKLRDVEDAVTEVRRALEGYSRTVDRAVSQSETQADYEARAEKTDDKADITGRIEVTEGGDIKLQLNSRALRWVRNAIVALAAGGGLYGIKEAIQSLFGG